MIDHKIFLLLKKRGFLAFFLCQFLNAFKDNFMRTAFMAIITFKSATLDETMRKFVVSLSFAFSTLPYIFFSSTAGELSDKYDKAKVIKSTMFFGIAFILIGILGVYSGSWVLILLSILLIGLQSTIFGTVKYSIMPDILKEDELIAGNALVEASTFIAILLGIIIGGLLIVDSGSGFTPTFTAMIIMACSIYFFSIFIPNTAPAYPNIKIQNNIFKSTAEKMEYVFANKEILFLIIAISWFWCGGGIFLAQMPNLVKDVLRFDEYIYMVLLSFFSCGTALGSLICAKLLKNKVDIKYSIPALVMTGFFTLSIWHTCRYFPNNGALLGIDSFFTNKAGYFLCFEMFFTAVFSGIFIVPFYSMLQLKAKSEIRSEIIAANNVINSICIVIGGIICTGVLAIGMTIDQAYLLLGVSDCLVGAYLFIRLKSGFNLGIHHGKYARFIKK